MSTSHTKPPTKIDLSSPDLPRGIFPDHGSNASEGAPAPTSPQLEKSAARAMSSTDSWKPSLGERRQSYHKEDHKHALQMSGISTGPAAAAAGASAGGSGFSERH